MTTEAGGLTAGRVTVDGAVSPHQTLKLEMKKKTTREDVLSLVLHR